MHREQEPAARNEFARYVADCRTLRRDYLTAIRDLQFQLSGGTIHYAVDFSEIFAYILPGSPGTAFALPFQSEPASAPLLEARALQHLFAAKCRRVLLSPYALELAAFHHRRTDALQRDFVDAVGEAFFAAAAARSDPEFQAIAGVYGRWRDGGSAPSDDERRRALVFVQKYAHHLLALRLLGDDHPLSRLRALLEGDILVGIDELLGGNFDGEVNQVTVQRWFDGLVKQRPDERRSASHLDAVAIAEVERANETLGQNHARVLLVTRSPHMHRLLDTIAQERPRQPVSDLLRHPRVFLLLANTQHLGMRERIARFAQRVEDLQALLELVDVHVRTTKLHSGSEGRDLGFAALFQALQTDWEAREGLEAFAGAAGDRPAVSSDEADVLFELLSSDSSLQSMVMQRIGEFDESLRREQQVIALYVKGRISASPPLEGLAATEIHGLPALRATSQSIPYSFAFRSSNARNLIARLKDGGDATWAEIVDTLREQIASDVGAEWFLVMGFLFGVLQKWELAEAFARRSYEACRVRESIEPDTHLFLAFCLRKRVPSVDRHREALVVLRRAIGAADREDGAAGLAVARLKKELAVHLLQLERYGGEGLSALEESGPVEDPLVLLVEAEGLAPNDPDLTVQVLNNLVYVYAELGRAAPGRVMRDDLRRLLSLQRAMQRDERSWAPFLLDTVAWATWKLQGTRGAGDVIRWLKFALESRELTDDERRRIEEHLTQVENRQSRSLRNAKGSN